MPAGAYFLFGTTSPLRGSAGVDRSVGTVKVKKGARKSVRLSLKPRKKKSSRLPTIPKLPGFPTARVAYVKVDYPSVWLQYYKTKLGRPGAPHDRQGHARHADHRPG